MPLMEEIKDMEIPAYSPHPQQDADALVAKEMAAMSVLERELSLNDVHGVSDVMDEEPGFVRAKMERMETELSKLTNNKGKEAYMQAEAQSKEYVTCDKFCLKFLRAEMFNARLAAGRMVRFFDEKKKLFGPDKLTKDIKLWDLDKDDRNFLERGIGQILPQRDRAGRLIITWMTMMIRGESDSRRGREEMNNRVRSSRCGQCCPLQCVRFSFVRFIHPFSYILHTEKKLRTLYYILMAASEDEETQKKGIVGIIVNIGKNRAPRSVAPTRGTWKIAALLSSLPCRFCALHFCVDDPAASSQWISMLMVTLGSRVRARVRIHKGELCEYYY
jgi:hypothetical protein